jgi:hypothetical protein
MDPTASVLFSHFTSAALVVWIMQVLKKATWFPWLQMQGQAELKRFVSLVGALAAHTGINYAWHANLAAQGGYQLLVTIPPLSFIVQFVWRWIGQYVMQEGWYKLVYERLSVPGVQNPLTAPKP